MEGNRASPLEGVIYCPKCKKKTETKEKTMIRSKNDRPMCRGRCVSCDTVKSSFVKNTARN